MRRMALLVAVVSSMFCVAQQQEVPIVPQSTPAVVTIEPPKPVQATPPATEATPPATEATPPTPPKAAQAPCKPKPEKSAHKAKFPTSSGHEPI
jgi:hypothetical protein